MVRRELVALLGLSSWCLVIVVWLFLTVPWDCLQFVIVVSPDLHFLCSCKLSASSNFNVKCNKYINDVHTPDRRNRKR